MIESAEEYLAKKMADLPPELAELGLGEGRFGVEWMLRTFAQTLIDFPYSMDDLADIRRGAKEMYTPEQHAAMTEFVRAVFLEEPNKE